MKTKKLTPLNVAPVQRDNVATVSRGGNAIAPEQNIAYFALPFAGDDSE
jgi:prenylated cyclic peptide (anacyclamide/piricyclamide family)